MSARWTEEELAKCLAAGQARVVESRVTGPRARLGVDTPSTRDACPPLSEEAWMQAVRQIAREAGWTFQYHVWDSRRTVYGYPDLSLVHREPGHPLLMVELKTDTGQVTQAQQAWLEALTGCSGVVAEIWRPSALDEIVKRLRGDQER